MSTNRTADDGLARGGTHAPRPGGRPRRAGSRLPRPRPSRRARPAVDAYDEETAALGPEALAERAWAAIEGAGDLGLYGYVTTGLTELAVASSTGLAVSQALTDATVVALAARTGCPGYANATSSGGRRPRPGRRRGRGSRSRSPDDAAPGRSSRARTAPCSRRSRSGSSSGSSAGARSTRSRSSRGGATSRAGSASSSSTSASRSATTALEPGGLPKRFDFEGVPKQPCHDRRGRRRPRRRLGPANREAGRPRVDGPRARAAAAVVRAAPVQPVRRARRRVGRRARRARRRRHLRDPAPLRERRRRARGDLHRDDARRHVPDRGRAHHAPAREPPLHDVVPRARSRPARRSAATCGS